jgi:hypothetical protein
MAEKTAAENWYPTQLTVGPDGNRTTCGFIETVFGPGEHFSYAEFGIYKADTARRICERYPNAVLHLFDFEESVRAAREKLSTFPNSIFTYGNTQKYNDSYNWSLLKLLETHPKRPIFDYCFIDGAHTFAVDGLTFYLCDRLLRVGGYMDFDDYRWRIRNSSMDPSKVPVIADQYTEEQINAFQVKMIVDILVKSDDRYEEVKENRVYRKVR